MDLQSYILPANGKPTPKSVERKRKMAEAMMQSGMDTSPIGHWSQGAARMAQALVGGMSQRKLDQQEAEGQQSARDAMTKALMGGDKASMLDAIGNPWMDNASMPLVVDAWKAANPQPEMKILENGQVLSYVPNDPNSVKASQIQGYQAPPPDPYTLGEGQTRFDGNNKVVASGVPKSPDYSINIGGEPPDGKLREELDKAAGETWGEYQTQAGVSSGLMQDMQILDELIKMAPQGPITGRLAGLFKGSSSAGAAFQSVVSRVAPTLRTPGSGSTSDIEYEGMLNSLPALSNNPEANAAISGMMQAKAQINMERGAIVDAYHNKEISASYARKQLAKLNKRSIMTPELKQLIGGLAPAPTAVDNGGWSIQEVPEGQ